MAQAMNRWRHNLRLFSMLRQLPPRELLDKIWNRVRQRIGQRFPMLSRRWRHNVRLRAADRLRGFDHGNRLFWKLRHSRDCGFVENRLFHLQAQQQPQLLEAFVRDALLHSIGATIVMMLARSGITRDILARQLCDPEIRMRLARRIPDHPNFGTGLVAAAALLLDPDGMDGFAAAIDTSGMRLSLRHGRLIDSFSTVPGCPVSALTGSVREAPGRRPCRHRLIVADRLDDLTRLSLLFAGAGKVSVLSPANLFGRADFDDRTPLHARPDEITVIHPRSRITRFSTAYHDLHDETRQVAEQIVADIDRTTGGYPGEAAPYMAMHLADALFFRALRIAAIGDLLADGDIDQIQIVAGDRFTTDFFQLLAGVQGLTEDPRVEFVSLARTEAARMQFSASLSRLLSRTIIPRPQTATASARPLSELLDDFRAGIVPEAAAMRGWPAGGRAGPRVLFFTIPYSTYNRPTAGYIDILSRSFDTMTGVVGTDVAALFGATPELSPPPAERVQLFPSSPRGGATALDYAIQNILERTAARLHADNIAPSTRHVLETQTAAISAHGVVNALVHWERLLQWFARLEKTGGKPDILVVSPLRPSLVGMSAAAARRFAIPSLAIEPHIINSEYCRYTRIGTDHYGTVSGFLAQLATTGFAIPAERIHIIGSPRLIASPPVPPGESRDILSRRGLARFPEGGLTVSFFSQPSKWPQISEVWRIILGAVTPCPDMQLLLKVHPEEGAPRIAAYLEIAAGMGLAGRVQVVNAPPDTVIAASDLVLACYSTTIVEAALAGRPVFSVTNGETRYPISQHEVVGAPQYRDVEGLSGALGRFRDDPAGHARRVQDFMEQNRQFVTGPAPHLEATVRAIVSADPATRLRPAADLPPRLFIEGPYRVYDI